MTTKSTILAESAGNACHSSGFNRGNSRGFTLAELMIAIGILGFGLAMVMALFPAALTESGSSIHDMMGSLICKNAVAVAKAKLQHSSLSGIGTNLVDRTYGNTTTTPHGWINGQSCYPIEIGYTTPGGASFIAYSDPARTKQKVWIKDQWKGWYAGVRDNTGKIPAGQIAKITGNDVTGNITLATSLSITSAFEIVGTRGFLLLARQAIVGNNDYQLVAIAYQKESAANYVKARRLTGCTFLANEITFTAGADKNYAKIGSPVIDPASGNYAIIVSKNEAGLITLDHALSLAADTVAEPFVVVEEDSGGTLVGVRSPAISVLVTRTSLP